MRIEQLKLNELFDGAYVFAGSTNVGVIAIENRGAFEIYFIDSGETAEYAQKIFCECERVFKKFFVKAIIATHGHADHVGGNSWLVEKTGCQVWATQKEKSIMETPEIPGAISAGGFPLPEFHSPYHRAEASFADRIISGGEKISLGGGFEFEFVPLPGHYMEMVGVLAKSPNGKSAFFAGDGIFGREMLARYWMPFLYDVKQFKHSLEKIGATKADFYVPSHGGVYEEIAELVEFNLLSTISNEKSLERILKKPRTWEEVLKEFADENEIPLRLSQYTLVGSTVRSYLSYLYSEGRIKWHFENNFMLWSTVEGTEKIKTE